MAQCVKVILEGNPKFNAYQQGPSLHVVKPRKGNTFPQARKGYYKNILFDSQLEIQCAKSLDKAEIRWWAHPRVPMKTYGTHQHCVPDFYLPDYDVFLEVRPENRMDEELDEKCHALEREYGRIAYRMNEPKDVKELIHKYLLKYHATKKTAV